MGARYRIIDEPTPGAMARVAVRPLWPLLGLMLGGAWLAWPWFAINARALGSPRMTRTFAWIAAALLGTSSVVFASDFAGSHGWVSAAAMPWFGLVFVCWKLTVGYALFEEQTRTSELFAHFGGKLRNGVPVVLVALFFGRDLVAHWIDARSGLTADVAFAVLW